MQKDWMNLRARHGAADRHDRSRAGGGDLLDDSSSPCRRWCEACPLPQAGRRRRRERRPREHGETCARPAWSSDPLPAAAGEGRGDEHDPLPAHRHPPAAPRARARRVGDAAAQRRGQPDAAAAAVATCWRCWSQILGAAAGAGGDPGHGGGGDRRLHHRGAARRRDRRADRRIRLRRRRSSSRCCSTCSACRNRSSCRCSS